MIGLVDDLDRPLCLDHIPRRIVSLVPSLTETICDLGCGSLVVGASRHCCEPAAALAEVTRVGGTKNPDVDRIVELAPDVVILNVEENRREDFEELDRRGIATFVTFPKTVAAVPDLLRRLGRMLDAVSTAEAKALELESAIADAPGACAARTIPVFCPIWKNPWMTFGRDTFAADLLRLVGAANVFSHRKERYFEVSLEEVARQDPIAVLLPDEPYIFSSKDVPALEPLENTPALRRGRIHFVDGKALFWFGTRTAEALAAMAKVIHHPY